MSAFVAALLADLEQKPLPAARSPSRTSSGVADDLRQPRSVSFNQIMRFNAMKRTRVSIDPQLIKGAVRLPGKQIEIAPGMPMTPFALNHGLQGRVPWRSYEVRRFAELLDLPVEVLGPGLKVKRFDMR